MDPERIVSLAPSNTEILHALGAWDRVVATTAVCDRPAAADDVPSVGGWTNPDVDAVVTHEPDLVLASDALQDDAVERCRDAGLDVKQVTPTHLHGVCNSIKALGEWVGCKDAAREIVDGMNEGFREHAAQGKTRVYCEEWHRPPMASGNWVPRLVDLAGGTSFLNEGERSREVTAEEVRTFDPEVIVLHPCGYGDAAEPDAVVARKGWADITAVETGNVHVLDDALLNRPGPRLVDGLARLRAAVADRE